jgi:hypothetical protein
VLEARAEFNHGPAAEGVAAEAGAADRTKGPPELTVAPCSVPPSAMISTPPPLTVALLAVPPESTSSITPLLTAKPVSV